VFRVARTRLPVWSTLRSDAKLPCVLKLLAPSSWTRLGALPGLDALKVCKDFRDLRGVETEIGHVRMTCQDASGKRLREAGHRIALGERAQGRGGEIPAHVATSNRMAADALQLDNPPPGINLLWGGRFNKYSIAISGGRDAGVRQTGRTSSEPKAGDDNDASDAHRTILEPALFAGLT
jgi:hypothetical protein